MEILIIAPFATIFVMLIVTFICYIYLLVSKEKAKIHNIKTRYNPDANGNYPMYYNPANEQYLEIQPGNPRYPSNNYLLNPNTQPTKSTNNRVVKINETPWHIWDVTEKTETAPEQIEQISVEQLDVQPEIYTKLLTAKRGGQGKVISLETIAGVKRGASAAYKKLSQLWDSLN